VKRHIGWVGTVSFALLTVGLGCTEKHALPTGVTSTPEQGKNRQPQVLQIYSDGSTPDGFSWYWVRYSKWPTSEDITSLRRLGVLKYVYASTPDAAVALAPSSLARVRALPGVVDVSPVGRGVRPLSDVRWGVSFIGAPLVWSNELNQGAGIKIGFLDTGIDNSHPDLVPNYAGGFNALNPGQSPDDENGHGTMVAGVLAAAWDGYGVAGVAPQAKLYAIKVCTGSDTLCVWPNLKAGVDWAMANGIQVLNISLGGCDSSGSGPFRAALDSAYARGMVVLAAAGNQADNCGTYHGVLYPAKWTESVIAVSGVDSYGHPILGYRYGPEIEVAAPGVGITSDFPTYLTLFGGCSGGSYPTCTENGTSLAAPDAAGVAALLLWSGAATSPAQVRQQLHASVTRLNDSVGYGVVNAPQATTILPHVTGITGPYPIKAQGSYTYTAAFASLPFGFPPIAVKWVVTYSDSAPADSTGFQFQGAHPTHVVTVSNSLNNYSFTITATPRDTLGRVGTGSSLQVFVCFGQSLRSAFRLFASAPTAAGPGPNKVGGC
jgi:subtilisin